jgi:hypothetical protein
MNTRLVKWTMIILLAVVSVASVTGCTVEVQAVSSAPESRRESDQASAGPVEVNEAYKAYGFLFEQYEGHERFSRFTEHEIGVLGGVIEAYADLVGGPAKLNALVNGPVRVRRDLHEVVSYTQAGRVIGLGRGAFDLDVTTEANYYTWGASTGDELAQIVFGHEIGHRWIDALRKRDGRDWGDVYGEHVRRDERLGSRETWPAEGEPGGVDAEEEAVTNLALYVLGRGYRWTFLHDAPATAGRQLWIDGWVSDLVGNSSDGV